MCEGKSFHIHAPVTEKACQAPHIFSITYLSLWQRCTVHM